MSYTIPASLSDKITRCFKEKGAAWLQHLPSTLDSLKEHWDLEYGMPSGNMSYNYIIPATLGNGNKAMLKVGVPHAELWSEIDSLKCFTSSRIVNILDESKEHGAFLMEYLQPASLLHSLKNNPQETEIAAHIMNELPTHNLPDNNRLFLNELFEKALTWLSHQPAEVSGKLPAALINAARSIYDDFKKNDAPLLLLHGDLHHENIIYDETRGWTAIDPKGYIERRGSIAARFLLNKLEGLSKAEIIRRTDERLEIMSAILSIDRLELLSWAIIDSALSSIWSLEDNGEWFEHTCNNSLIFLEMLKTQSCHKDLKRMAMSDYIQEIRNKVGHALLQMPSVTVLVFNDRQEILLLKHRGTGTWVAPGGAIEPCEKPADAAVREMWEETGCLVELEGITGVYGGPEFVVDYLNGDSTSYVMTVFKGRIISGELTSDNEESMEAGYFPRDEISSMKTQPWVQIVIDNAVGRGTAACFEPPRWRPRVEKR